MKTTKIISWKKSEFDRLSENEAKEEFYEYINRNKIQTALDFSINFNFLFSE